MSATRKNEGEKLGTAISLRALDREQINRWKKASAAEQRSLSNWIRVTLDSRAEMLLNQGRKAKI